MPPTMTEVDQRLTQAVHETGQKVERQGERLAAIESSMGWVTKIGGFFVTLLVIIFGAIGSLSWNASALNSEVKHQGARLEKIDQKLEQQGARLEKIDQKLEKQAARLDKVDQKLEQQAARLEKVDQKLDLIIQQTAQIGTSKSKP